MPGRWDGTVNCYDRHHSRANIQSSPNAFGKPLLSFIACKQRFLFTVWTTSVSTQVWLYGFDCNVTTIEEDVTFKLYPGDSQTQWLLNLNQQDWGRKANPFFFPHQCPLYLSLEEEANCFVGGLFCFIFLLLLCF